MNSTLFDFIIKIIVPSFGLLITYFVIPYIKECTNAETLEKWKTYTSLAVKCAEMLWTETGHGTDKKQYVIDYLNKVFNAKKTVITEEQMNVLIEASVQELNASLKGKESE